MQEAPGSPRGGRYVCLGVAGIVVLAGLLSVIGITWGLPSRAIDPYLFGGRPAWPGAKIAELVKADRRADTRRGADVDVNPLGPTTQPVALNDTDEKRAAIILRYRLYTNQPDEMVTMMALASMKPGQRDFDPKLYQYGGLFVYPVGVLLKVCSLAGLVTLKSDLTYYLDHPEAFGRFYIVARCYVATFGLAGVLAVFWIARRIAAGLCPETAGQGKDIGQIASDGGMYAPGPRPETRNPGPAFAGVLAALLYALMPVVINMAHEAKPHLPGAVLMLFAVLAAMRYVERGTWRGVVITGILCGASFGMVLSCWPVFVVIPLMTLLRRMAWSRRVTHMLIASAIGILTYFTTNPYVLINLFVNPDVLRSNIGNTLAMFPRHGLMEGVGNVGRLVAEGTSMLPAEIGLLGVIVLCVLAVFVRRDATERPGCEDAIESAPLWLLLAPATILFVQFAAAGADKPGEYGRFAIFPDIALVIGAAVLVSRLRTGRWAMRGLFAVVLVIATGQQGYSYVKHFIIDARTGGTRMCCAGRLAELNARFGPLTIATPAEPAPYCMPPLDVIGNKLYLLPHGASPAGPAVRADVIVAAVDEVDSGPISAWTVDYKPEFPGTAGSGLRPARISWADKPFVLSVRRDLLAQETLLRHAP